MASTMTAIKNPKVVSHEEWLAARKDFLAKEKEFTHRRDELSKQRRQLPWEKVEKPYVFDGPNGKETLGVPVSHVVVAPIIVGVPNATPPAVPRKDPEIRWDG